MQWIELVSDQTGELIVKSLLGTREAFLQIRHFLREMGKAAGVPVSLSLSKKICLYVILFLLFFKKEKELPVSLYRLSLCNACPVFLYRSSLNHKLRF